MRKTFRHYFKPTKEALTEAWQECLFSFDASVLLNVYGYSNETREKLISFTEQNDSRVRLPHQFGLEYARNRVSVIVKQVNKYQKVEESLRQIMDTSIAPKRDHPYLSKRSTKAFRAIQHELGESRKAIEKWLGSDPYAERIFKAFENRIGKCPSDEELTQLHQTAEERYKKQIPPGFADRKEKDGSDAHGDCIGWLQLLQIAKDEEKSIVFVTDDFKEDWWYSVGDRQIGPRPELVEEFTRETQQEFYMYTSENFLRAAKEFMAADIREDIIDEIRDRLEGQRETRRAVRLKPLAPMTITEIEAALGLDSMTLQQLEVALSPNSIVKTSESKESAPGPQDKPEIP